MIKFRNQHSSGIDFLVFEPHPLAYMHNTILFSMSICIWDSSHSWRIRSPKQLHIYDFSYPNDKKIHSQSKSMYMYVSDSKAYYLHVWKQLCSTDHKSHIQSVIFNHFYKLEAVWFDFFYCNRTAWPLSIGTSTSLSDDPKF